MSCILYLGTKKKLNKFEFNKEEVYKESVKYKSCLYQQEGLFLDNELDKYDMKRLSNVTAEYNWYIVKGILMPFDCEKRVEEVMPDYYYSNTVLTSWFIKFLNNAKSKGNEIVLIELWAGDSDGKNYTVQAIDTTNTQKIFDFRILPHILYTF